MSPPRKQRGRGYPRTLRVNELLREILADELERLDDDRLELVTVTGVDAAPDLRHARVWFDSIQGEEGDAEVLEALGEARVALQSAVGRQARLKRVPELDFAPDPAVRSGEQVDKILRGLHPGGADAEARDDQR